MALKALDKQYESFSVGDVVVHNGYGAPYGVQVDSGRDLQRR